MRSERLEELLNVQQFVKTYENEQKAKKEKKKPNTNT